MKGLDYNIENNNIVVCVPDDIKKIEKGIKALEYQISIDNNEYDRKIHTYALNCYQDKFKVLKLDKLRKKLKQEEELFDNAVDNESKELHLSNIHKLNINIAQLNPKNKIYDDLIKAPFEYIGSEEEYLFFTDSDE